jgi:alanine-glyoxylate transaminase / (R)-3-amino-2-methylpropionate-pyruvate transaminase
MMMPMMMRRMSSKAQALPAFDYKPVPYNGPSKAEVAEKRAKYLNPALFLYYKDPIMLVEGKAQYVFDEQGSRYLDLLGGIVTVSVGHTHPRVTAAGVAQMQKIMHTTTIYYNPEIALFAEELAAKLPDGLDTIYFVNSGSEANDLAVLMSRLHTHNWDVLALRNCYHGMSQGSMGLTALNTWKYPVGQGFGVHHVMNPNPYRGPFGYDDERAGEKYAEDVADLVRHVTPGSVAAFIAESIQGVGGTVEFPDGYLQRVYETVRGAGGLCIADEVQTGFGRTGSNYWGFQNHGVTPDIVTMAKGIGNGAPLAAVATRADIASSLGQKIHFNTYGGNPVSCAIGREVLRVIDDEQTQRNSAERGAQFLDGFRRLQEKHDIIGDVRGKGLMLGAELVTDRETKAPATQEVAQIFEELKNQQILVGKGGLYSNVFRIKPPMCITADDVDYTLQAFDRCLSNL